MRKLWLEEAWEEYISWQTKDKAVLKKINRLLKDIDRYGYECSGKPEPLKGGSFWVLECLYWPEESHRLSHRWRRKSGNHPVWDALWGSVSKKTPVLVKRAFLHLWTASASPWAHHLQWVFFRRLLEFKSQKSTKVKRFRIQILKLCRDEPPAVCSLRTTIAISTLLNIENFRAIMHTSAPIN